jgi:hypothetical protein
MFFSTEIGQLIAENKSRHAATLLHEKFRAQQNEQLASLALLQVNAQKRLLDQAIAGTLSTDEIRLEQNRINKALLDLAGEYGRLYEDHEPGGPLAPPPGQSRRRLLWLAVPALALLGFIAVTLWNASRPLPDFDVEVRVSEAGSNGAVLTAGRVQLQFGRSEPLAPRALDEFGTAMFRGLGRQYWNDSIRLRYYPPENDGYSYSALQQTVAPAAERQLVRFEVARARIQTKMQYTLWQRGRPLAGVTVLVDGKLEAQTNDKGYFELGVPKPPGSIVNLVVLQNGARLWAQDLTISNDHQTLPIQ